MTTVLVTGAGGSIGSALSQRITADRLVLVDRAESALYDVGLEVPTSELALCDITDRERTRRLMERVKPDIVYHAAAYKHVPLMESHPSEAVLVNIGGTLSVLDAAEAAGVPRLVLVSTDKAVDPSSVMGATKRVAEWLVADRARSSDLAYVSVRFSNVIGTAGSVILLFRYQLERGLPLTITHPDCTRYFMSIDQATSLILEAGELGTGRGDIFVKDIGEPIRIADLARDVARDAGFDPDQVTVKYIGLRPGERLHERLFHEYEVPEPTTSDRVSVVRAVGAPDGVEALAAGLLTLDDPRDDLFELVAPVAVAA